MRITRLSAFALMSCGVLMAADPQAATVPTPAIQDAAAPEPAKPSEPPAETDPIKLAKPNALGEKIVGGAPGPYPLVVRTTVMEGLANAGGFRDFANLRKITILRGTESLYFNYKEVRQASIRSRMFSFNPATKLLFPNPVNQLRSLWGKRPLIT
jgi:hypothetical protein